MKKWDLKKRGTWAALATGFLIVGVSIAVLANSDRLTRVFDPEDYRRFDDWEDYEPDYDSIAGDGEQSDLADQDESGENRGDCPKTQNLNSRVEDKGYDMESYKCKVDSTNDYDANLKQKVGNTDPDKIVFGRPEGGGFPAGYPDSGQSSGSAGDRFGPERGFYGPCLR